MAHSRFSPSAAERWMVCPGSIAACEPFPDRTSVYAEEGTRAHELLEMALRLHVDPSELVDGHDEKAALMAVAVGHAYDYVNTWVTLQPGADYHVEQELIWGEMWGRADLFGTSDVVLTSDVEHAVVDLKFGQGVAVEATGNFQLRLYLLGVRSRFGPRPRYQKVIIQPRAQHELGPVRTEVVTDVELLEWAKWAQNRVTAAEAVDAPRVAGDHCRWCRAAGVCTTLAEHSLRVASEQFSLADALSGEVLQPTPAGNLTTEQLGRILRYLPLVDIWVREVNGEALQRAMSGQRIPGYKLVVGRSPARTWLSPVAAEKAMRKLGFKQDEYAPRELVSPAGADKLIRIHKLNKEQRDTLASIVVRSPGKPTLTNAEDPRDEYLPFDAYKEQPDV